MTSVLDRFSAPARAWFAAEFGEPTEAQSHAWAAIASGEHCLVIAPTGSGKTLAAFLWALDRIGGGPAPREPRTRVVYVSPLKALAVDVERNLRAPLAGIAAEAARRGSPWREVTVGVRSGDTPQSQRRRLVRTPPDILITTPESLYLMLTSAARSTLSAVDTVIVDEVHSVAATKRGAHLALTLERLEAECGAGLRRIGLSATARPAAEVARFLCGDRPVRVVDPPAGKRWELTVRAAVDDMADLPSAPAGADEAPGSGSIWPHIIDEVADAVERHRTTIVFTNSRRLTERITAQLNERHSECGGVAVDRTAGPPAALGPTTDVAFAVDDTAEAAADDDADGRDGGGFARAHHGSVSKQRRARIEADLKSGALRCVVATSSLELGIDMGAVDLVIQIESPPSVASGLQRIGRAGHRVGDVSRGMLMPKHRLDLLHCAVTADAMLAGAIEDLAVVTDPLDVLAQQTVAAAASADVLDADRWFAAVRRSAPFGSLARASFDSVLDMLAGRYPSDEFAELRPRLVWDRTAGTLTARPGAARLAVTSGGTIPDRGAFAVYTVGERAARVGELDEEMVYESRVGDVFALGTSSWRIAEITHDRVLVSPAPGRAGRLPFWHGEGPGRPAAFGAAIGRFTRALSPAYAGAGGDAAGDAGGAVDRLTAAGLDERARANLLRLLAAQRSATGSVPDDATVVVERFVDELGDWRLVLHSPYGRRVHAPWALAVAARLSAQSGIDAQPAAFDDGIVLRLPARTGTPPGAEVFACDPDRIDAVVRDALGGSALFAARFRECAARALLLPRRDPGRRAPLWQQRHRSAQLLGVVSRHPGFPILHETVRECLRDVYDLDALRTVLSGIGSGAIAVHECETAAPSPFASALLFDYIGTFIYDADAPLAERRAAALSLDPSLLSALLGDEGTADLLDPEVIEETAAALQWRTPRRRARDAEAVADMLRLLGPLTAAQIRDRAQSDPAPWIDRLSGDRRVFSVPVGGARAWAVVEDAARLRDALGAPLPEWMPDALAEPVPDPLGDLVARYARTHGPFATADAAAALGLGPAVVAEVLTRLEYDGRVRRGRFLYGDGAQPGEQWCDSEVLHRLRRLSLRAARRRLEPVDADALGRFLPGWQHVGGDRRVHGIDGLYEVVDQLAGAALPASALETLILPSRVSDYSPAMLDTLTASGEVYWSGRGRSGARDGWIALHTDDPFPAPSTPSPATATHAAILDALAGGGGFFFRTLADAAAAAAGTTVPDTEVVAALWDLVWAGAVTGDTLAPLRALLAGSRSTASPARARTVQRGHGRGRMPARPRPAGAAGPPAAAGRWSRLPAEPTDPTVRIHDTAQRLLARYGVVTAGVAAAEAVPGGFAELYRVLARFEEAGHCRRGYVVAGLGGAQFAAPAAVDLLRGAARSRDDAPLVLAAADPANPFGAALAWPAAGGSSRPNRAAGALVVLHTGTPTVFLERGGRSLLTFTDDPDALVPSLTALARAASSMPGRPPAIERVDSRSVHGDPRARILESSGFRLTPRGYRPVP